MPISLRLMYNPQRGTGTGTPPLSARASCMWVEYHPAARNGDMDAPALGASKLYVGGIPPRSAERGQGHHRSRREQAVCGWNTTPQRGTRTGILPLSTRASCMWVEYHPAARNGDRDTPALDASKLRWAGCQSAARNGDRDTTALDASKLYVGGIPPRSAERGQGRHRSRREQAVVGGIPPRSAERGQGYSRSRREQAVCGWNTTPQRGTGTGTPPLSARASCSGWNTTPQRGTGTGILPLSARATCTEMFFLDTGDC